MNETLTTILVIEDEAIIRESMVNYLEDEEFKVFSAENGRLGIEVFERERPDLVMTDLRMPEMDGLEVLRHIGKLSPETPLIVVSGTGNISDSVQAMRLGAWDYILKPIRDMSIISIAMDKAMERARLLRENSTYLENLEVLVKERTAELEQANTSLTRINSRLKKVVKTIGSLSVCSDISKWGHTLLCEFAKLMDVSGGSLFLLEETGLRKIFTLDSDHVPEFIPFPLNKESILARVIEEAEPLMVEDVLKEDDVKSSGWRGYKNGSILAFPLHDEMTELTGILTLHSKNNPPFIEQDKEIGTILAASCCETLRAIRASETLRTSEVRFRQMADMLPEAIFEADNDFKITYINQRMLDICGYSIEDIVQGLSGFDIFSSEERDRTKKIAASLLKGEIHGSTEYMMQRKNGSTFSALTSLVPIIIQDQVTGFRGVIVDIAEQKKSENVQKVLYNILDASVKQQSLEKLFKTFHDQINTLMDANNFYVALYDKESEMYTFPICVDEYDVRDNVTPVNLKGGLTDYIRLEGEPCLLSDKEIQILLDERKLERIGEKTKAWIGVPLLKDGEPFGIVSVQSYSNPDAYTEEDLNILTYVSGHIAMAIERKHVEDDLEESENSFRSFMDSASDYYHIVDKDFQIIYANPSMTKRLGYGDLTGKHLSNLFNVSLPKEQYDTIIKTLIKEGHITFEHQWKTKDGEVLEGDVNLFTNYGPNNEYNGVNATFRDITEQKRANEELVKSEFLLKFSQKVGKIGSYNLNMLTGLWTSSETLNDIYGIDENYKKDINNWSMIIHPDQREKILTYFQEEVIGKGKRFDKEYKILDLTTKKEKWVHGLGELQVDADNNVTNMIGTIQDITDRKQMDEARRSLEGQLLQAQKMESIGRLAGGIAHDFNNILTGIMGYAELLKIQFKDLDTNEGAAADVILNGSKKAAKLTQQLLGFARIGEHEQKPLNVNTVLKDTLRISEKIFEKQIQIMCDYDENIYNVSADKNQLDQVFTNLFINAKDAMPSGGELIIVTENKYLAEDDVKMLPEIEIGEYVLISISDTGIGMQKEISVKIFEPFFTTKGEGRGTGLGLASVYGIIKNHNGNIYCESEPGMGTTFKIYLPSINAKIEEEEKETEVLHGNSTVLIVDDEEDVLDIAKKILEHLEYTVLTANNGDEALEIYKNEKENIGVIMLDMIMPGKTGQETYYELKNIDPDVRVLLSSGHSQKEQVSEILKKGAVGFIQKPFSMQKLSAAISDALKEYEDFEEM